MTRQGLVASDYVASGVVTETCPGEGRFVWQVTGCASCGLMADGDATALGFYDEARVVPEVIGRWANRG